MTEVEKRWSAGALGRRGSAWMVILAVVLLWAVAYLPGLGVRDLRLEEGRRATPAAEMLATGDWVVPRLYGEPYLNKPPGFFWMAAGVGSLRGEVNELSVRIPSVVSVLLGAMLVLFFGRKQLGLPVRALAAVIFLAMPIMLDKGTLGEIDATLAMLTFAAVAFLWEGFNHARGRFKFGGWLAAGGMLALATLVKGPAGLVQFYAMVVPFALLSGKGRWKNLVSPGHFLMLAMAILPAAVWVGLMVRAAHIPLGQVMNIWGEQTGVRSMSGKSATEHYLMFPLWAIAMLLPWALVAMGAYVWRKFPVSGVQFPVGEGGEDEDNERSGEWRDFWWMVIPALPVLVGIFWIWPKGSPRYLMMAAYPVATQAAVMMWAFAGRVKRESVLGHWRNFARMGPIVIAVAAAAGVIVAAVMVKRLSVEALVDVSLAGAGCCAIALGLGRLIRRVPLAMAPMMACASVGVMGLCVRGLAAGAWLPYQAQRDSARLVHRQIEEIVPRDLPVYTTRLFSNKRGDDYYNIQFYLRVRNGEGRRDPRALAKFGDLPAGEKAIVILAPGEWGELVKVAPGATNLGTLWTKNGPGALVVGRVPE